MDGEPIDLPPSLASTNGDGGTIIDSGTTLAYLPQNLYNSLIEKVKLFFITCFLFILTTLT